MLRTHQLAQLPLDDTVVPVGVFDHSPAESDVLLKRQVAAIDHDAGESFVDAFLAQLETVPVVQMNGNRNIGETHRGLDQLL